MTTTQKLNVSTNQEAFDKVVRHLAGMTRPAKIGDRCAYLTEDGSRCAIGALVDDPAAINGTGTVRAICVGRLVDPGSVDVWLLADLQRTHDADGFWSDAGFNGWADLRRTAECFSLDTSVLDEVSGNRTNVD